MKIRLNIKKHKKKQNKKIRKFKENYNDYNQKYKKQKRLQNYERKSNMTYLNDELYFENKMNQIENENRMKEGKNDKIY